MVASPPNGLVADFCASLRELQVASGISRSTLAREIHYGRSQLYDILDGRIRRPPEWDRLVEPLLRTCLRGKPDLERLVADWRTRYEVLLRVHDELTRRTGRAAEPVPGPLAGLPRVPWLAILDPDVTTTAQSGLYLVYLFDIAVERVFLSMNQGATAHQNYYRQHRPAGTSIDKAALAELVAETTAIRARLDPALLADTEETIDLGADGFLPEGYEAGNVAAVGYELAALPPEWVAAHRQRRTRKHEALINSFVRHADSKGWTASTKGYHPRDLVL